MLLPQPLPVPLPQTCSAQGPVRLLEQELGTSRSSVGMRRLWCSSRDGLGMQKDEGYHGDAGCTGDAGMLGAPGMLGTLEMQGYPRAPQGCAGMLSVSGKLGTLGYS